VLDEHRAGSLHVLVDAALRAAFEDDQQVRLGLILHGGSDAEVDAALGCDRHHRHLVDVLDHERRDAVQRQGGNRARGLGQGAEGSQQGRPVCEPWDELDDDSGD